MSHGFKNAMIAMLMVASAYFYILNELHADLVDDAFELCFFPELEPATIARVSHDPDV